MRILDLGLRAYGPVLELQKRLVVDRAAGRVPDSLILVEHEPVYTLGRNAAEQNVLLAPDELAARGVEVVRTGRGGEATFHGPGQLVGYPILDLSRRDGGAVWYVRSLEEVLIRALAGYGVEAGRDPEHRGVWVGLDKIAAIGVRITRRVTMHGFALNVCPDLSYYEGIVPCGIPDRGVTALNVLRPDADMADVKARVVASFAEVLGYERPE